MTEDDPKRIKLTPAEARRLLMSMVAINCATYEPALDFDRIDPKKPKPRGEESEVVRWYRQREAERRGRRRR